MGLDFFSDSLFFSILLLFLPLCIFALLQLLKCCTLALHPFSDMFAVLLFFMFIGLCLSRPRLHSRLLSEEDYLSRQRTAFINGVFILFVFIRHISQYHVVPGNMEQWALLSMPRGQLLVTPFFFFSGYGLMCSLRRNRDKYVGKLLQNRFPKLWLHFVLCVALYWSVNTFLVGKEFSLAHICLSALTWESCGNSTWYIGVSLLAYLLLAAAAFVTKKHGYIAMLSVVAVLFTMCLLLINVYKASFWVNTALCIPAGMAYALYRKAIEQVFRCIPLPTWLFGVLFMWLGCVGHRSWLGYDILGNIGAVLYAFGLCLMQGCVEWKRPLPLLVWCGGPALFYLYILQRLPMLVGAYFGWNTEYRDAYVAACFLLTLLLAYIAIPLFKRVDKCLFGA